MVRSLGYPLLPAASRAAELPTQITQSSGFAPTASTATAIALPSRTTCRCLCAISAIRFVDTNGLITWQIFISEPLPLVYQLCKQTHLAHRLDVNREQPASHATSHDRINLCNVA